MSYWKIQQLQVINKIHCLHTLDFIKITECEEFPSLGIWVFFTVSQQLKVITHLQKWLLMALSMNTCIPESQIECKLETAHDPGLISTESLLSSKVKRLKVVGL